MPDEPICPDCFHEDCQCGRSLADRAHEVNQAAVVAAAARRLAEELGEDE